jgi:pyruvate/2-oxoglutarate dehydrogenase complex dihydrolipoamide acyltransferase (E2) component
MTALEALRAELNSIRRKFVHGLAILIRALTKCLADHPGVNAHFNSNKV